jgi:hypothetical protein
MVGALTHAVRRTILRCLLREKVTAFESHVHRGAGNNTPCICAIFVLRFKTSVMIRVPPFAACLGSLYQSTDIASEYDVRK